MSTAVWNTTRVASVGRLGGERRAAASFRSPRDDARRVGRRDRGGGAQSRTAILVLGPDQRLEPRDVVGTSHVERVEVDAAAPHDLGQPLGHRHRPVDRAVEHHLARAVDGVELRVPRVPVAVPVGIEAEARRMPRPRAARSAPRSRRAPGRAGRIARPRSSAWRGVRAVARTSSQCWWSQSRNRWYGPIGDALEPRGREHQVRLPLRRGELVDERDRGGIAGHAVRPVLVAGRHAPAPRRRRRRGTARRSTPWHPCWST